MIADKDRGASSRVSRLLRPNRTGARATAIDGEIEDALTSARDWLLRQQDDAGFWVGELEGDTILESEYVLLMAFLGRHEEQVCVKACRYLLEQARPDGGWSIYPGGPFEISASVKAYFALKLVGYSPDDPIMVRAREMILDAGGAQACNSFTRFYLALLGQLEYDDCPCVPPELVLLPHRLNFSLSAMSAWTRTIVVPLSIISMFKPVRRLPADLGIVELFLPKDEAKRAPRNPLISWENFFLGLDRCLKFLDRRLPAAFRRPGVKAAHRWMLEHFENSEGLGAIFPPMIYTVIALQCLGYDSNDPTVNWALERLEDLLIEENDTVRIQPCVSPVWDTAISTIALADSKLPDYHPALLRAVRWLLEKEVRTPGDWRHRGPNVEPTGWHFQFFNEHYPDVDDTAMVLLALSRTSMFERPEVREAVERGVKWLLAMQNRDGGWAAFDRDITNQVLTKVPFADHNAMLDPSCADITARVIELLGTLGYKQDHPAAARGLEYLLATQEEAGSWYGRWGVNYIYGTWQVLQGLRAIDFPVTHPAVKRAADWLEQVQQIDGGWGETCLSYDDPRLMGQGEPTASQTAWAVLGLIAAGRGKGEAARRGVQYLTETQRRDGTWSESAFTGTGFPRVFYLKYHLYRIYFPIMAVSRYRAALASSTRNPQPMYATRIPAMPRPFDP